jgi:hypothetical protein
MMPIRTMESKGQNWFIVASMKEGIKKLVLDAHPPSG